MSIDPVSKEGAPVDRTVGVSVVAGVIIERFDGTISELFYNSAIPGRIDHL